MNKILVNLKGSFKKPFASKEKQNTWYTVFTSGINEIFVFLEPNQQITPDVECVAVFAFVQANIVEKGKIQPILKPDGLVEVKK